MTWAERELPILKGIHQAEETGGDVHEAALAAVPGLAGGVFGRTIEALKEDGYLNAVVTKAFGQGVVRVHVLQLLPRGKRAVGQWPSGDAGDVLLAILQTAHDQEPDQERKGKLAKVMDGLGGMGKDFVTELGVSVAKGVAGLP